MRKTKQCTECDNPVYAKGLCKYHYNLQLAHKKKKDEQKKLNKRLDKQLKRSRIKKQSEKRKAQLAEYSKIRKAFFEKEENHVCAARLEGCTVLATDIHHLAGRENELLNQQEFFIGVCRSCHDKIHSDPHEARKRGLLI